MIKEYEIDIPSSYLGKAHLIFALCFALPCLLLYMIFGLFLLPDFHLIPFLLITMVLLVLHQLLHCLGYLLAGAQSRFRVLPWCFEVYTETPIKISAYRLAMLLPPLLLGWLPLIPVFFFGDFTYFLPVLLQLCSSVREYIVLWELRFFSPLAFVRDHPETAGCLVYVEEEKDDCP